MSIQIVSPRKRVKCTDYSLDFNFADVFSNGGYSFPCDKNGNVFPLEPAAEENYRNCIDGKYNVVPTGVLTHTWSYVEPAIGKCYCGRQVPLVDYYHGACECECGQWYSVHGNALVSPQYWEEPIDYDNY